jgi:hypothetical protein
MSKAAPQTETSQEKQIQTRKIQNEESDSGLFGTLHLFQSFGFVLDFSPRGRFRALNLPSLASLRIGGRYFFSISMSHS